VKRVCVLTVVGALVLFAFACGGGGKTTSSPPSTVASISVSPSSPSIAVGATQQFSATALDSAGNIIAGVTFTWTSSNTTVATISGTGLATAVSVGTTQITASASGVSSSNDSLTVTPRTIANCTSGSESLLNGGYAFLLKGFDSSANPALVAGALTFDGAGTVTGGTLDMNLNSGVEADLSVTSGYYNVGSDQRGCLVITTSAGTQNYRFSVAGISGGVASTGHMIDFDSSGPFTTGILRKQTGGPFSNASLNGNYVFGGASLQNSAFCAPPCKAALIGVIGLDGNGGVSGGSEDFSQNGVLDGNAANTTWPATPIPIASGGTYNVSTSGRATLTFSLGGGTNGDAVLYLVSPGEAFFLSPDPQTGNLITAGAALLQSGTPFAANPLSGAYIGYDSGTGGSGVGRTDLFLIGPLTAGSNALAGVQLRNTGGTFAYDPNAFVGSTYSVSANGRAIIAAGAHAPVLYLVSTSQAFLLAGNASVDDGFLEAQSGGPFSTASANGTYALGMIDPVLPSSGAFSGVTTLSSASNSISTTLDGNGSAGSVVGQTQSGSYSIDSTGLGLLPLGCSISASPPTCDSAFYVVSPAAAVLMDVQSSNPKISSVEQ